MTLHHGMRGGGCVASGWVSDPGVCTLEGESHRGEVSSEGESRWIQCASVGIRCASGGEGHRRVWAPKRRCRAPEGAVTSEGVGRRRVRGGGGRRRRRVTYIREVCA